MTFYDLLSLKNDVNVLSKKTVKNFLGILKVTNEKSRTRIRIQIRQSVVRIPIQILTKMSRTHNTEIKKSSINISNNAPPCSMGLTLSVKVSTTKKFMHEKCLHTENRHVRFIKKQAMEISFTVLSSEMDPAEIRLIQ